MGIAAPPDPPELFIDLTTGKRQFLLSCVKCSMQPYKKQKIADENFSTFSVQDTAEAMETSCPDVVPVIAV